MNVHIPEIICMDCHREMRLLEGTNIRICSNCELEVTIEVIEQ